MTPRNCETCPARHGGSDCQCSRDYTAQAVRFMWQSVVNYVRCLSLGDWLAIVMVLIALGAWLCK